MIILDNFQLYHLTGHDVQTFLQGQLCTDISHLTEGQSQLIGICNAKGRLVASPYLLLQDGEYYLAIEQAVAELLFKYWKPYLMISRVQAKLCEKINAYGVTDTANTPQAEYTFKLAGKNGGAILFNEQKLPLDTIITEAEWFEYLVHNGVVTIQAETSKLWMPNTLGYENFGALSFQKGCYVGQEILARVHYKGTVKKEVRAYAFERPTLIKTAQEISDQQGDKLGVIAMAPHLAVPVEKTLIIAAKQKAP